MQRQQTFWQKYRGLSATWPVRLQTGFPGSGAWWYRIACHLRILGMLSTRQHRACTSRYRDMSLLYLPGYRSPLSALLACMWTPSVTHLAYDIVYHRPAGFYAHFWPVIFHFFSPCSLFLHLDSGLQKTRSLHSPKMKGYLYGE